MKLLLYPLFLIATFALSDGTLESKKGVPMDGIARKGNLPNLYEAARTALHRLEATHKQQATNYVALARASQKLESALMALAEYDRPTPGKSEEKKHPPKGQDAEEFPGVAPPPRPEVKGVPPSEADKKKGQQATEDRYLKKSFPSDNQDKVAIETVPLERRTAGVQAALKAQQRLRHQLQTKVPDEVAVRAALAELREALEGIVARKDAKKPKD